jgi:hypothetical protein
VFNKTQDENFKKALFPTINNPHFHASDLPSGLKHYIQMYPSEFRHYFDERRHELGLLKSVLRTMSPEAKRELRHYYQQHGKVNQQEFMDLIRAPKKRTLGLGEEQANMFDLVEQDTYDDDAVSTISSDTTITSILGGCHSCNY